jgi:hypothetical protein
MADPAAAQQAGSIRGVVYDKEFDTPLPAAKVEILETGQKTATADQGNYVFGQVAPGRYTMIFSRDGYVRQVKADVLVQDGKLTDVDIALTGEFAELDEFVVQDVLQAGAGSELALLNLRFDSPSLMDSIGSEQMSRAGASDAAAALKLVAGATVQDGKYAVVRGLPDRYVSSQMNNVRLPTADETKRAVELDQFPSAIIESIQVSKTFTPDQQGDASGGAVNLRLKGIPEENTFQVKGQAIYNTQVAGRDDFLSYHGGGLSFWGQDSGARDIQSDRIGQSWFGAMGASETSAPVDSKWSASSGGKLDFGDGVKIGGFAGFFYERTSFLDHHERSDAWWMQGRGNGLTPQYFQGSPTQGSFNTGLYDVEQGKQQVRWGGLGTCGIETEHHSLTFTYLYTRVAEDAATVSIDTRGKEYFFPGYDPNDPQGPGNGPFERLAAPYIRDETLKYTERVTRTAQVSGRDQIPIDDFGIGDSMKFHAPEFDWVAAYSFAGLNEPDKRLFGAIWEAPSYNPGAPPFLPPFISPATWLGHKPDANFTLGNAQRIWEQIYEDSSQYAANLKFPFEQWTENKGYMKFGYFSDHVERKFNQDTFTNLGDQSTFNSDFSEPWSAVFPSESHPIFPSEFDVDYHGDQKITAWYGMMDLPVSKWMSVIGGLRFESSSVGIVNTPERFATWFPPGSSVPVALRPGDADADFSQRDVLPSIELVTRPVEQVTLRAAYSQTVAHQTFKELTPILQQEFLGGPIFIGNPSLQMSSLKNYDLRADYAPYEGSLVSGSYFRKDIKDPIEYVQKVGGFTYTTAENYPSGYLNGWEFEVRQALARFYDPLDGVSVGANATFIDSRVYLPSDESAGFGAPNINAPISSRDMTNAPEHLYNFYATYDILESGTQFSVFYTVQGDTLIQGAGISNLSFVPSIYSKEYGTLNFAVSQQLSQRLRLMFQAKNVINPKIETVYRSPYIGGDQTQSSYRRGTELSLSLTATF